MIQSPRHCASVGRSGFPYSEIRIRRVSQSLRISANFSIVSKAWGEALFHRLRVGTVYHRIIGGISEHVGIDLRHDRVDHAPQSVLSVIEHTIDFRTI